MRIHDVVSPVENHVIDQRGRRLDEIGDVDGGAGPLVVWSERQVRIVALKTGQYSGTSEQETSEERP